TFIFPTAFLRQGLCSPCCPGAHFVDQGGVIYLPLPPNTILRTSIVPSRSFLFTALNITLLHESFLKSLCVYAQKHKIFHVSWLGQEGSFVCSSGCPHYFGYTPVNYMFLKSNPTFHPTCYLCFTLNDKIIIFVMLLGEDLPPAKEERFSAIHKPIAVGSQPLLTVGTTHISKLTDDQLIKEFLSGSYCFHGGVGWWKYEFCYGKYVHQYHEDKDHGKTSVVVGTWNQEDHVEWAKKNIARAYHLHDDGTQTVRMVSHFYGNGDICDITDKPRQVTVKLKCKESDSPHAVTVYMLEPHSCQYILGVESPVICKILDTADENGLLSLPN
ncbi:endoplasmic reticulum lectin 1, partial [Sigmodon hispidus]